MPEVVLSAEDLTRGSVLSDSHVRTSARILSRNMSTSTPHLSGTGSPPPPLPGGAGGLVPTWAGPPPFQGSG